MENVVPGRIYDAEWRAEMARYLRQGEGDDGGSLVFVSAEAAGRLADALEQGCAGERFMELPIAADGRPLRVGERVWVVSEDLEAEVRGVRPRSAYVADPERGAGAVRVVDRHDLAHERPDSWERIAADLRCGPGEYFNGCECGFSCMGCEGPALNERDCWQLKCNDAARRIEKLAGDAR